MFIDRNLIMSGSRSGTQRKADGSLFKLESPADLQQRRAEVGLPEQESRAGGSGSEHDAGATINARVCRWFVV
ncbi:hypothetical protein FDU21_15600 [Xanthomonas oryzae pv. oryzae]|nr:hypothetical protein FDU21_15600 [Xanthomonas oryzae pv. oryzae]